MAPCKSCQDLSCVGVSPSSRASHSSCYALNRGSVMTSFSSIFWRGGHEVRDLEFGHIIGFPIKLSVPSFAEKQRFGGECFLFETVIVGRRGRSGTKGVRWKFCCWK